MTEFTVTAIRYQMGEHLSYEEKDAAARQFVASLKIGQQVVLAFEPDNPGSPNKAIAVYIDYKRIGYIADEECNLVRPLLNEGQRGKGTIVRKDRHVTFFISIPGASDIPKATITYNRVLPESPLGNGFRMPYTKDENALQLIASTLVETETSKENMPEILLLTRRYVPLSKISICREDRLWRRTILKKLEHLLDERQILGMSDVDIAEMETLCLKLRDVVGDMHRSAEHWPERVFVNHLERLRNDECVNYHLYKKYCESFLDEKHFDEVDKDKIKAEYERLSCWLKNLEWSELRNPKNLMSMGFRVNYLDLSRWELYDLYSILLLLEKLELSLPNKSQSNCKSSEDSISKTGKDALENKVLKKNHNGKCIDFQALHKLLGESFVDEIKYGYEWLAPWRMLYDLSLLEDTTLTAFAEQMNNWYPHAKKPCSADSMGDYCNPYLGSTAFVLWDENVFKKHKTSKQSINGYRKLYNDCEAIKEALKSFFKQ